MTRRTHSISDSGIVSYLSGMVFIRTSPRYVQIGVDSAIKKPAPTHALEREVVIKRLRLAKGDMVQIGTLKRVIENVTKDNRLKLEGIDGYVLPESVTVIRRTART